MSGGLRCILSNEEDMSDNRMKVGQLPTDQNVLTALLATSGGEVHQSAQHELEVFINSVVAVTWVVNKKATWYLGYITEICKDDNMCLVDHLERVYQERNDLWRFPKREDKLEVDFRQIIAIKPEYEWEIQNIRTQKMRLKNSKVIDEAVQDEKEN